MGKEREVEEPECPLFVPSPLLSGFFYGPLTFPAPLSSTEEPIHSLFAVQLPDEQKVATQLRCDLCGVDNTNNYFTGTTYNTLKLSGSNTSNFSRDWGIWRGCLKEEKIECKQTLPLSDPTSATFLYELAFIR